MSNMIPTAWQLFDELKKIMDLPDNVTKLTLHLEVNTAPTLEITKFVTFRDDLVLDRSCKYKILEKTNKFYLVPFSEWNNHPLKQWANRRTGESK